MLIARKFQMRLTVVLSTVLSAAAMPLSAADKIGFIHVGPAADYSYNMSAAMLSALQEL